MTLQARESIRERSSIELIRGIVDDTRVLVEAHVAGLREDMGERMSLLGTTLTRLLIAISVLIVMGTLFSLATAATLVGIGMPLWAALWIVTAVVGVFCLFSIVRARAARTASARSLPSPLSSPSGNHDHER